MSIPAPENMKVILATDCGSTTSKARFFMKIGNEFRYVASGEAPTTVEAPYEDVTVGVRNAIREVEELTGYRLLGDDAILPATVAGAGVDIYVTTSSAGGGLQMTVVGVVRNMTAESAE
ncbi:methylaspartate mutase, partial [miscellaneous Crenarchaeota group archaeon SMTZ1-55]